MTDRSPAWVVHLDARSSRLIDVAADAREIVTDGGIAWVRLESQGGDAVAESLVEEIGHPYVPISMPEELSRQSRTVLDADISGPHARNWHFDQSFADAPPTVSALYARAAGPEAAPTAFCDGAAVFASLSKGLQGLLSSTAALHHAYHPIEGQTIEDSVTVARHPCAQLVAGDVPAIFVAPGTVNSFDGWSQRDSGPLLEYIWARFNWPEFGYVHRWSAGDLLVWPNLRYPHRAVATVGSGPRQLVRFLAVM